MGVRREDIISGMYMGGAGAFLSIPALCMWDVPTTGAFLLALQLGGIWERIKVFCGFLKRYSDVPLLRYALGPLMPHVFR